MPVATQSEMPPLKELKPISEFAEVLGANKSTIIRWATIGVKPGPIKLRAWLLSGWRTTEAEVRDFVQRRTASKVGIVPLGLPTSNEIQQRHKAATARLAAKGVRGVK
jgi:predicted DNA-binding transcriptional regulator AlpA